MTKTELKDKLKQLNLSQKEFARFSGCSYQSVKQWKEHKVPNWVSIVIENIVEWLDTNYNKNRYLPLCKLSMLSLIHISEPTRLA